MLRWEGIVIDPVGAIFTLLVFEFIVLKQNAESYTHLFWTLGVTAAVGLIAGALFGYLLGTALRRVWLPRYLQNPAVLAIMLAAFGVSNAIADESGLLTVTVMGIWLANMRDVDTSDILAFKEELSAILISALFIILAARLDIRALWNMGWPLLLLLLAVQFIARPLCIAVSTALFPALARSAAAVLDRPARHRRRGGQFAVRADAAAQRLSGRGPAGHRGVRHHHRHRGAAKPDQRHDGALAAGAAAKTARRADRRRQQRGAHAGAGADQAERAGDRHRQQLGILPPCAHGRHSGLLWPRLLRTRRELSRPEQYRPVLALSPNRHQNALAVYHFGHLFGEDHVFAIRSGAQLKGRGASAESSRFRRHEILFNQEATYGRLSSLLAVGPPSRQPN